MPGSPYKHKLFLTKQLDNLINIGIGQIKSFDPIQIIEKYSLFNENSHYRYT